MIDNENEIEKLLENSSKNPRLESYAGRQALKEDMLIDAEELDELLHDEDVVVEYAKRFIADDLREFRDQIREIRNEKNSAAKIEKLDNLLFDFQTRIPDIIELLEK